MTAHVLLRCGLEPAYLIGGALTHDRAQRRLGDGGVARGRGRRVGPLDALAARRRRRRDERRARPPRDLRLAGRGRARPSARCWPARRRPSCGTAPTCSPCAARLPTWPSTSPRRRSTAAARRFEWRGHAVRLAVPGAHNARNAAAALEAAALAGADPAAAAAALADFAGAGRRFQALGTTSSGALVIDDYAHHPTEVAATIDAARTLAPRRVVAVFQPHLYSRTQRLARDFGAALARADVAAVLDVYPARERAEDFPGVTGPARGRGRRGRRRRAPGAVAADLRRRRAGPARAAARRRPVPGPRRRRRRRAGRTARRAVG